MRESTNFMYRYDAAWQDKSFLKCLVAKFFLKKKLKILYKKFIKLWNELILYVDFELYSEKV